MGSNSINNKTNEELRDFITECEEKYHKLLKVANKLADEMDSLSEKYLAAKDELSKRSQNS